MSSKGSQHTDPIVQLCDKEFVDAILKVGSYITMCEGKKINASMFFALVFENSHYKQVLHEATAVDDFREIVLALLYLHPSLLKSKNTKTLISRINGNKRRTVLDFEETGDI